MCTPSAMPAALLSPVLVAHEWSRAADPTTAAGKWQAGSLLPAGVHIAQIPCSLMLLPRPPHATLCCGRRLPAVKAKLLARHVWADVLGAGVHIWAAHDLVVGQRLVRVLLQRSGNRLQPSCKSLPTRHKDMVQHLQF